MLSPQNQSQSGKGDKPRPVDLKIYRENYDAIKWKKSLPKEENCLKITMKINTPEGVQEVTLE